MMCRMNLNRKRRALLKQFEERLEVQVAELQKLPGRVSNAIEDAITSRRSGMSVATTAAWVTGAVAVVAAGLYAGKELRSRYKFKRRTPYDYYAHSGDRSELEFGVGI